MKIAISNSHHPKRTGAGFDNITEYSENILMVAFMIQEIQHRGHEAYLVGTGQLQQKIKSINKLDVDIAIEIHLNDANTYAQGCETLYCPGSKSGKTLAQKIQKELIKVTGNKDRGVKEGWYKMILPPDPRATKDYFLAHTNCPAIIVEPFFIDNIERNLFLDNFDKLKEMSIAIVNGILN